MMKHEMLAGMLLMLAMSPAMAEPGTALRDENMLSGPASSSSVVGKVAKGTAVDIVGKQGGWVQIKSGKTQGWVRLLSVRAGSGGSAGASLGDVAAITKQSDSSRVVAVAGVRGLNEEDLKGAKYNAEEMARLEKFSVSAAQAQTFADKSGLKAQNVASLPKPKSESGSGSQSSSPWGF